MSLKYKDVILNTLLQWLTIDILKINGNKWMDNYTVVRR